MEPVEPSRENFCTSGRGGERGWGWGGGGVLKFMRSGKCQVEEPRCDTPVPADCMHPQASAPHCTLGPLCLDRFSGTGTRPGQAGGGAAACTCTACRAAAALLPRAVCWRSGLAATELMTAEACMAAAVAPAAVLPVR